MIIILPYVYNNLKKTFDFQYIISYIGINVLEFGSIPAVMMFLIFSHLIRMKTRKVRRTVVDKNLAIYK